MTDEAPDAGPPSTDETPDAGPPSTDEAPDSGPPSTDEAPDSGPAQTRKRVRSVLEWAAVAVGALVIAMLVRTFLVQAFSIPSESMEPTLTRGDRLLVEKVGYRFGPVRRGDVVVFDSPQGELVGTDEPLIKRVIGLEGETVEFRNGAVNIDGRYLRETYLDSSTRTFSQEVIPGCVGPPSRRQCTLAEGTVFVMGDNRSSSRDSRFFGPIEIDTIIGRAWLKYWPPGDFGTL